MQALTGQILLVDRKLLTVAIEASKSHGAGYHQTIPPHCDDEKIHEVAFEGLKMKKAYSAKANHRELMKQALLRLGGIVGIEDGAIGVLTYGAYLDKDRATMHSIGPEMSLPVSKKMTSETSAPTTGTTSPKTSAFTDMLPTIELPDFLLAKKARCRGRFGHKGKMAVAMLRTVGIYGENITDGFGSIVYGSFSSEGHLQY